MFHLLGPASVQVLYYGPWEIQKKKMLFHLMNFVPIKTWHVLYVYPGNPGLKGNILNNFFNFYIFRFRNDGNKIYRKCFINLQSRLFSFPFMIFKN